MVIVTIKTLIWVTIFTVTFCIIQSNADADKVESSDTKCPAGSLPKLLPHEADCSLFYACQHGKAILKKCPSGLQFNRISSVCDYPGNVDCQKDSQDKLGRETTDQCPRENPDQPVLLPHKTDCGKFYICDAGVPRLKSCQPGLHFNPALDTCDYPEKAGCDSGVNKKGRDGFEMLCPLNEDGNPILRPHETDCRKFYTCSNGITLTHVCQHGLHFNAKLQQCDYPEKAGCEKGVNKKGRDGFEMLCPLNEDGNPILRPHETDCRKFYTCSNGITLTHVCQHGLHFNAKLQQCDYPEKAGCEKGVNKKGRDGFEMLCPLNEGGNPILRPHETDCRKFYTCSNGITLTHVCQHGLHFNAKLQQCDYPEKAGCEKGVNKKGRDGFEMLCPLNEDGNPILRPHETDCRKFYTCSNGITLTHVCQHGLHFNAKLQQCDYPEKAGCEKVTTKVPKGKSGKEIPEGVCSLRRDGKPALTPHEMDCRKFYVCNEGFPQLQSCQSGLHFSFKLQACDYPEKAGCENGVNKKGKDGFEMLCPLNEDGNPILRPHETDCRKFYTCSNGITLTHVCQHGLHFNAKLQQCDYPEKAGCEKDVPKKEPKGKTVGDDVSNVCSSVSTKKTVLVPHPDDCSKFFICDSGTSHQKACPAGLHFSTRLQACDYPKNVQCGKMGVLRSVGVPSSYCPEVSGKIPIFYRHPSNCSIYYLCNHGLAYEFVCPSRLHFNLRGKRCDYEDVSMCPTGSSGKND